MIFTLSFWNCNISRAKYRRHFPRCAVRTPDGLGFPPHSFEPQPTRTPPDKRCHPFPSRSSRPHAHLAVCLAAQVGINTSFGGGYGTGVTGGFGDYAGPDWTNYSWYT